MRSELKSANLEVEDLSKEILACEKKVYETFLGPKPDVEFLQKVTRGMATIRHKPGHIAASDPGQTSYQPAFCAAR